MNQSAKNPYSDKKPRFRQKNSIFQQKINPDPGEKIPNLDEKTQIQVIFHVDPTRFWSDLAKSHRFQWDFCQIWVFLIIFMQFPHSDLWWRLTRPLLIKGLIYLTRLLWWLAASEIFCHPIPSGWFQVGHKPDPDRLVDSPTCHLIW